MRIGLACAAAFLISGAARADSFIILSTHSKKADAQRTAGAGRAWVLDTNLYSKLTPNLYAVVIGPYRSDKDAAKELAAMKGSKAYVKDAGAPKLPGMDKAPPALVAALLGQLGVRVEAKPGGENPCVPAEPYLLVTVDRRFVPRVGPERSEISIQPSEELGPFFILRGSGEIQPAGGCAE